MSLKYHGLVAVHLGAGYHAPSNTNHYKNLIEEACQSALIILKQNGMAVDGVCEAIRVLENSPITNAGKGSNLTLCGKTECDASVMDGTSLNFGAVGAIAGVKNPILVAKQLLLQQNQGLLELERIPPCILTGEGARTFAIESKCEISSEDDDIPNHTKKLFLKAKRILEKSNKDLDNDCGIKKSCTNEVVDISPGTVDSKDEELKLDTVGAICIDTQGNIASAVSSGGIMLKHSGRIGQAACFGAGCWAQNTDKISVGVTTSGGGEYLIRTTFAQECAKTLLKIEDPLIAARRSFKKDFIESPFLRNYEPKLAGNLMLTFNSENGHCELVVAHTTKSFCYGYITGKNQKSVTKISRLESEDKKEEIKIEAIFLRLK